MISRSNISPAAKSDGVAAAEFMPSSNNSSWKELDSAFFFLHDGILHGIHLSRTSHGHLNLVESPQRQNRVPNLATYALKEDERR